MKSHQKSHAGESLRVKQKKQLASLCGCSTKSLTRWEKEPDFPKKHADGWDVDEVTEWMTLNGQQKAATGSLRDQNLLLKNEQLRWEIDRDKELYLKKVDVQRWLGEMIGAFETSLFSAVNRIAAQVAVQEPGAASTTLRKEFKKALAKLSTEPWIATKGANESTDSTSKQA